MGSESNGRKDRRRSDRCTLIVWGIIFKVLTTLFTYTRKSLSLTVPHRIWIDKIEGGVTINSRGASSSNPTTVRIWVSLPRQFNRDRSLHTPRARTPNSVAAGYLTKVTRIGCRWFRLRSNSNTFGLFRLPLLFVLFSLRYHLTLQIVP